MSLGAFFRDYVYIPLGGNRKHQYLNLFVVWFLTGMWHGASWNFILWGLWFGFLIILERLFLKKLLDKLPSFISHIYLLFTAMLGWVLFFFTDLSRVWDCLRVMFGAAGSGLWDMGLEILLANNAFWLALAFIFCLPVVPAVKGFLAKRPGLLTAVNYAQAPANLAMLFVCTTLLVGQSYNAFLYYRF